MALHAKRNCQGTLRNLTGRNTQDLSRREVLCVPTRKAKKMARYRLKSAHQLFTTDGHDVHLPGDAELEPMTGKPDSGTVVGDGTAYVVKWPTLEMEPLDDEAREMIAKEEERLRLNEAAMDPLSEIPLEVGGDDFEKRYVPGFNKQRRTPKPDGAAVTENAE